MKKFLLYTFFNYWHLTFKLINNLERDNLSKYYIRGRNGLNRLLKYIQNNNFDFVLGLGDYRINAKRIRIEEKFINKYGKNKILEGAPEAYTATWELPIINNEIYTTDRASNGPCNRSGYLISHQIATKKRDTKFAFVHIPRSYNPARAKQTVRSWIKDTSL